MKKFSNYIQNFFNTFIGIYSFQLVFFLTNLCDRHGELNISIEPFLQSVNVIIAPTTGLRPFHVPLVHVCWLHFKKRTNSWLVLTVICSFETFLVTGRTINNDKRLSFSWILYSLFKKFQSYSGRNNFASLFQSIS